MKILFTMCVILLLASCSHPKHNEAAKIQIVVGASTRYDLEKNSYTVYFIDQPPLEIKFHLAENDRQKFYDKIYRLNLNHLKADVSIEKECLITPVIMSVLKIQSGTDSCSIAMDTECGEFSGPNAAMAANAREMILYITRLIDSLPEIKNAPRSNIVY